MTNKIISLLNNVYWGCICTCYFNAFSIHISIALITNLAISILWNQTVSKLTSTSTAHISRLTSRTFESISDCTTFNRADPIFQSKVGHAISAHSSIVSDTSLTDLATGTISGQIISTVADSASVFVVILTVRNFTSYGFCDEWVIALTADSVGLGFTSEYLVFETGLIHQTISGFTFGADINISEIGVLRAIPDAFDALSRLQIKSAFTVNTSASRILS